VGGGEAILRLPPHGATIEITPDDLVNNDVIIQASLSCTRRVFAEVVDRLNAGPSFLITHRVPLDAVATLRGEDDREPRGKVVVDLTSN
jgi:threonine dehydrogenase-like Zn-dependent dehydrogenase